MFGFGGETTTLLEKKPWSQEKEEENNFSSVSCFVLLENSEAFSIDEKSYNLDVLGQPMFTWVARACPSIPVTIETEKNANPLEVIRPYLKDSEYTVVLYSDTPLLTRSCVEEILEYVKNKGLNVCKLTRGFVYKTDYIKRVGEVFAPQTYYFDEEDFITAVNFKQLSLITDILKSRIIDFHMKNGVYFKTPESCYIEANVSIGKNTIILGHTMLTGKTQIGENCTLNSCKISSSKLYDRVELCNVTVEKSVIEPDVVARDNTKILNGSLINKNTSIGVNNVIIKSSVGENVNIGDCNYISSSRIHDLCEIKSNNTLSGQENKIIRMLSSSRIGNANKISAGVMLGESVIVSDNKVIMNNVRQGESV